VGLGLGAARFALGRLGLGICNAGCPCCAGLAVDTAEFALGRAGFVSRNVGFVLLGCRGVLDEPTL